MSGSEHREYDAIVVGAGHNGLCLGAYLQRAGLKTLIIERRHEEGGGINTEEPVMPGYRHNMHAQYMEFFDIMPMIEDFDLESIGLRTIMPEVQAGIAFADGRPSVVIHRPDMLDRTYESISQYSKADADVFLALKDRAAKFEEAVRIALYNPPSTEAEQLQGSLLEGMFGDLGVGRHFAAKSPKIVIDELFESSELRALLYRVCVEWGFPIDTMGTGAAFFSITMWTLGNWKLALGGTHTLAKVMTQACYREGVDLIENAMVDKVIVEDGRAVGVVARGQEYRAKVVASNADVKHTLLDLVGEEHLSDVWATRAKAFRHGPSHVLGTLAMCLYEPPAYKSAKWGPDIDRCFYTVVGYDDAEDMAQYIRDAYAGVLPQPGAGTWVNSLWDRSQAPPDRHSATGWYFFPSASELTPAEWQEVRATYNERFLARWREFAPNMTPDNVIAHRLYTPDQMEQKNLMFEGDFSNGEMVLDQMGSNRPFPEAAHYRAEIEGLYFCGPSSYPGGGAHAACGYNAYKAIVEDLGIPVPIAEGRPY